MELINLEEEEEDLKELEEAVPEKDIQEKGKKGNRDNKTSSAPKPQAFSSQGLYLLCYKGHN